MAHCPFKFVSYTIESRWTCSEQQKDMYYMSFPKDRNGIKALVFGLFFVETAQTVLITHDLFAAYASGWGNLSQLASAHLEWFSTPILSGIGALAMR
jgi:hypothetical protein